MKTYPFFKMGRKKKTPTNNPSIEKDKILKENQKQPKEIFKCNHCYKEFKQLSRKNKHQVQQLCLPEKARTYCQVCEITFETVQDLKNHLITKQHLEAVLGEELEEVIITHKKYDNDPYLSKEEVKTITTLDEGNDFTVNFKDNSTSKLSTYNNLFETRFKPTNIIDIQKQIDKEDEEAKFDYQKVLMTQLEGVPLPTFRQERILKYLAHFQNQGEKVMIEKFRTILPKFEYDDVDYLNTHIRESSLISTQAKQIYGNYMNKVVKLFTISYNKGITEYHGKDIIQFVGMMMK